METNNGHEPKVTRSVEELLDFESGHQNGHHDSDVEEDPSEGDRLVGDLEDGDSRGSFLRLFSLVDENVEERGPYEDQGNSTERPSEGEDDLQVGNGDSDEIAKNGPNKGLFDSSRHRPRLFKERFINGHERCKGEDGE